MGRQGCQGAKNAQKKRARRANKKSDFFRAKTKVPMAQKRARDVITIEELDAIKVRMPRACLAHVSRMPWRMSRACLAHF
jgi:hypothetical protein